MSEEEAWKQRVTERLMATPAPPVTTSKAAQFRNLLPAIEAALERGVRQADLVATLAEEGLAMTVDELRNALYRERKRQKGPAREASQTTTPPDAAPSAKPQQPPRGDFRQQRDKPVNW
jgi:hypothetical protein